MGSLVPVFSPAILALADGTVFKGRSVGAVGLSVGEVVFNTSMTGYQEILSDPSYSRQIVTLTYPHIGNVGVNEADQESRQVHLAGLVVRDFSMVMSNWRGQQTLSAYLQQHGVVSIADIDTRQLTRHLREQGAQAGCLVAADVGGVLDVDAAVMRARAFGGLAGQDLAQHVTHSQQSCWEEASWEQTALNVTGGPRVVVLDFGVKHNILRMLRDRGCDVIVMPARSSIDAILAQQPAGVLASNGPGDPEPCTYAIETLQALMARRVPLFGICLGHQLLACASGARTLKMKFGHHGANHPVQDLESGQVFITSQNHGFAVDPDSLPAHLKLTHVSLFDGSIQGIARTDCPAFSFQGHPEASPGPQDVGYLFDRFVALSRQHR